MLTIRTWLRENVSDDIANKTKILYGGTVTETNAENVIKLKDVDGYLVGTTSCKPVLN